MDNEGKTLAEKLEAFHQRIALSINRGIETYLANVQWNAHPIFSMRFEKLCWPTGLPFSKSDMKGRTLNGWRVLEIEVHHETKKATVLRKLVFEHECGALHTAASYIPTHPNCKCQILS